MGGDLIIQRISLDSYFPQSDSGVMTNSIMQKGDDRVRGSQHVNQQLSMAGVK